MYVCRYGVARCSCTYDKSFKCAWLWPTLHIFPLFLRKRISMCLLYVRYIWWFFIISGLTVCRIVRRRHSADYIVTRRMRNTFTRGSCRNYNLYVPNVLMRGKIRSCICVMTRTMRQFFKRIREVFKFLYKLAEIAIYAIVCIGYTHFKNSTLINKSKSSFINKFRSSFLLKF